MRKCDAAEGSVTAVDAKTKKAVAHYPLGDKGRCNGLALDAKNHVLFAACAKVDRAEHGTVLRVDRRRIPYS